MALARTTTPFSGWTPDQSMLSDGNTEAKGVIHYNNKFEPMKSLTPYNPNARMADTCLGAKGVYAQNGSINLFFADRSRLYRLANRIPQNVSKAGVYAADRDSGWCFEQFGDYVVATARGVSVPQVYQLGVSTAFADMTGSPPVADVCGRVKQFLLLGYDRTITWSAFNDISDWVPSLTTQAGTTDLDQLGGSIMAIIGGETGTVFQERKISRWSYVGPPTTWQVDEVEDKHGAISRRAVAKFGRNIFYVSEDGFRMFDGLQSVSIGQGQVDQYFATNLNYAARHKVSCAIDTEKKCFMVAFPSGASATCNEVLIYSIIDQKWTHDTIDTQMVFEMPREGITIEMTTEIANLAGSTDVDQITMSVDSPAFRENKKRWAGVDASGTICLFEGANRPATLETKMFEPFPGGKAFVSEIWPVTDGLPPASAPTVAWDDYYTMTWDDGYSMIWDDAPADGVTAVVKVKGHLLASAAEEQTSDKNDFGFCPVRVEGRYISVAIHIPAGAIWSEATGVHWQGTKGSDR